MAKHESKLPPESDLNNTEGKVLADQSSNERDNPVPEEEQIRMRAYELYLERGAEPDDGLEDWLQAEREFRRSPYERTGTQEAPAH